ncbi:thyroid hormone-inducible hepatic protein isoform X2 [Tamandua tetradactyla]|uniref:thyroid hormone-inducible hepatic protein isoform X2 n=1 Tax=Tamandua tetradactyla TaxID=48850 RepID=UPI0040539EFA
MQVLTKRYPQNCLLTVMDWYSATVRNMEQVVMIPSLLQDMQQSGHRGQAQAQAGAPDLYNYFTMLKAICVDMDHGLLPQEEWQAKKEGNEADKAKNEVAETEEAKEEKITLHNRKQTQRQHRAVC